jgi:hypothetical protein
LNLNGRKWLSFLKWYLHSVTFVFRDHSSNPPKVLSMKTLFPSLLVLFALSSAQAQFSGGTGSAKDPYQITSLNQLQHIGNHLDKHFVQTANIDASATSSWNDGKGFLPIGTVETPFTGTYDGNNYTITGLTIQREAEAAVGMFGAVTDGEIRDVILSSVIVSGGWSVGGLVGSNRRGPVTGVQVSGEVSGDVRVGGLVGQNIGATIASSSASGKVIVNEEKGGGLVGDNAGGLIYQSHANSSVSGDAYDAFGGLVGWNAGEIRNSHAVGDVTGKSFTGGLVGFNYLDVGLIVNSYATGNVTGESTTGGLAGFNYGEVIRSFATGNVNGINHTGGLVGTNRSIIFSSYSHGDVSGVSRVGGLVGFNYYAWLQSGRGEIEQSFSTGKVSGEEEVGGLAGSSGEQYQIRNSYWNVETSGHTVGAGWGSSAGAAGLEMSQMSGPGAFDHMNQFDFYNNWLLTDYYPANYWEEAVSIEPPPPAVSPVSPANNQTSVSINETLRWGGNIWINLYHLQVCLTGDFTDPILDEIVANKQYSMDLELETTYYWRIKPLYDRGEADWKDVWSFQTATTVSSEYHTLPSTFRLHQNYPNPFNPGTIIRFDVPERAHVTLEIFNSLGQLVATLADGDKSPGIHETAFDGTGLPSGIYVYRIRAGAHTEVRQMILVK